MESFVCSTLTGGHHSASTNGNGTAGNNYSRPEGQNVGNFLTDKNTSRVLAPPGGKSSFSFGGDDNVSPAKSAQANLHDPNIMHKEFTLANWLTATATICKKNETFQETCDETFSNARSNQQLSESSNRNFWANFEVINLATASFGANKKSTQKHSRSGRSKSPLKQPGLSLSVLLFKYALFCQLC